jgi:AcrR family transcriptional regulator
MGALRSMARINRSGERTRERILGAAERLFAARGVDAVSVRMITAAARVNVAAVNYHFGSKRRLVAALIRRRVSQLGALRVERVEKLESAAQPGLREVIAALVLPSAEIAADERDGGRNYAAFIARLVNHSEYSGLVSQSLDPITQRHLKLLARATPWLRDDARAFRFAQAKDLINRAFSRPAGVHAWLDQHAPGAGEPLAEHLIDFLTGAFREPERG